MSSGVFQFSIRKFNLDITHAGFVRGDQESRHFSLIEEFFKSQPKTVEKLRKQEDLTCEIFKYENKPVGMIVYKKENKTDENLKVENSLALKNLVVFEGQTNIEAFRACLLKRIGIVAEKNGAQSIHIKTDVNNKSLIDFLSKYGFKVIENSKTKENTRQVLKRDATKPTSDNTATKRKRSSGEIKRNGLKKPREDKEI